MFACLLQNLDAVLGKELKQWESRRCSLGKSDELTKDRSKGLVEYGEPNERITFPRDRATLEELTNTTG